MSKSNRNIDAFIFSATPLAIDRDFAIEALNTYLHELDALESGAPFSELGISKRRHSNRAQLISLNADTPDFQPQNFTSEAAQAIGAPGVAHLKLTGVMRMQDGMSSDGVQTLVQQIQLASASPNIKGIVVEVDSGGGESAAGEALKNAIADSTKPVVAYAHLMGSAALHAMLPAARIVAADKGSRAGSIGSFISLSRSFVDFYNNEVEDIYADVSPNKNKEFRQLLAGSREGLQKIVNDSARFFRADVKKHRALQGDDDTVENTLSGGMFFANEAKRRGLVDEIGTFNDALSALRGEIRKRKTGKAYAASGEGIQAQEIEDMKNTSLLNQIAEALGIKSAEPAANPLPAAEAMPPETGDEDEGGGDGNEKKTAAANAETLAAIASLDEKVEASVKSVGDLKSSTENLLAAVRQLSADLETVEAAQAESLTRLSALEGAKAGARLKAAAAPGGRNSDPAPPSESEAKFEGAIKVRLAEKAI